MSFDTIGEIGKVAEWRPTGGISLQIFDRLNLDYYAIGGLELFRYYQDESVLGWKLVFGSARHLGEIEEFRKFLAKTKVGAAAMITPCKVEDGLWYLDDFWTQNWKRDSAEHGDCLVGSWNVYVRSQHSYGISNVSFPGRMLSNLRLVLYDHGLRFLHNPFWVTVIRSIENTIGKTILVKRANGEEGLSPGTQIPPYRRRSAISEEHMWPVMDQAFREPKIREKLLVLGAHRHWITTSVDDKSQTDALWKSYHGGYLQTLLFEIFQREANLWADTLVQVPVWGRSETRTGGYEKLDEIGDAATGYRKLEALMSIISAGTGKTYIRGWKHWPQYCGLGGMTPLVTVGETGWATNC